MAIRDSTDDLRLLTYSITGGGSTVDIEDEETDDEIKAFRWCGSAAWTTATTWW